MKYLVTIKRVSEYTIEASSRNEAYKLAKSRKAVSLGQTEEAISLQELPPEPTPRRV